MAILRDRMRIPVRPGRDGFTLIELLVVIAIISVLASMLVPAVRGSLSQAKHIMCKSRARSIAMASFAYSGDNKGMIPPCREPAPWGSGTIAVPGGWRGTLRFDYLGESDRNNRAKAQLSPPPQDMWACPEVNQNDHPLNQWWKSHYGMNLYLTNSDWSTDARTGFTEMLERPFLFEDIAVPMKTAFIVGCLTDLRLVSQHHFKNENHRVAFPHKRNPHGNGTIIYTTLNATGVPFEEVPWDVNDLFWSPVSQRTR